MIDPLTEETRPLGEYAKRLGVGLMTLKRAFRAGELDAVYVGSVFRTTDASIRAYVDRLTTDARNHRGPRQMLGRRLSKSLESPTKATKMNH